MEMGIRNLGQYFFIYHDSLLLQFEINAFFDRKIIFISAYTFLYNFIYNLFTTQLLFDVLPDILPLSIALSSTCTRTRHCVTYSLRNRVP